MSPGVSETLVGRDRELQLLVDLLGMARRGSLAIAVIEGDAGIGKTALLARLAEVARERGVVVVRGAAHPLESAQPFGPVIDAFQLRTTARDERRKAIARLLVGGDVQGAAQLGAGQMSESRETCRAYFWSRRSGVRVPLAHPPCKVGD
jgi:hypothetical protein